MVAGLILDRLGHGWARLDRALGYAFLRLKFRLKLGYPLDLANPKTKNEKIQWRKLHDRSPLIVAATDKFIMRRLVRDMLGYAATQGLFTRLYQVAESADALRFDALPQRYVVKPTHGCGWIEIVTRDDPRRHARLRRLCRYWLRRRHGTWLHEWAYSQIKPRILIEECIADDDGSLASDLKFYVMSGRAAYAWSLSGRFSGRRCDVFHNRDGGAWNGDSIAPRPPGFDAMLRIAESIGAHFDYVRVDFLYTRDRFVLNELTLYNASGLDDGHAPGVPLYEFDRYLGDLWVMGSSCGTLPHRHGTGGQITAAVSEGEPPPPARNHG